MLMKETDYPYFRTESWYSLGWATFDLNDIHSGLSKRLVL